MVGNPIVGLVIGVVPEPEDLRGLGRRTARAIPARAALPPPDLGWRMILAGAADPPGASHNVPAVALRGSSRFPGAWANHRPGVRVLAKLAFRARMPSGLRSLALCGHRGRWLGWNQRYRRGCYHVPVSGRGRAARRAASWAGTPSRRSTASASWSTEASVMRSGCRWHIRNSPSRPP